MQSTASKLVFSLILILILNLMIMKSVLADVIMIDERGMPSIVDNDDFDQDVIMMPGMGNGMLINDDMVFLG